MRYDIYIYIYIHIHMSLGAKGLKKKIVQSGEPCNVSLSLAIGFKTGKFSSLNKIHFYRTILDIRL